MSDKFDKYINLESELEKDSRFTISTKEQKDKDKIRVQRQHIRIYIFYGIIIFILIFILKSLVDDLTLFGTVGLNLFSTYNIPNI
jgi:hypothetical protein